MTPTTALGPSSRPAPGRAGSRIRLDPDRRRAQFVELGLAQLGDRPLDQISLDELATSAGTSRALPFHYFPTRQDFLVAIVQKAAADELLAATDASPELVPEDRLRAGIEGYLAFIESNPTTYVALVRGAAGADRALADVCERTRESIVERIVGTLPPGGTPHDDPGSNPGSNPGGLPDGGTGGTPHGGTDRALLRLGVRGWVGLVEEATITWLGDRARDRAVRRDQLVALLDQALLGIVGAVEASQ